MKRLTASWLLVVLLVGVLAPAATALSADRRHACCIRKTPHCHESESGSQPSVRSQGCEQHRCCQSITGAQWAQTAPRLAIAQVVPSAAMPQLVGFVSRSADIAASTSVRAPPRI